MKHAPISPADPKLTAYALDELPPVERAAFEAVLRDNAEAGATVDEIRAFATQLEAALANEPEAACVGTPSGETGERLNGGAVESVNGGAEGGNNGGAEEQRDSRSARNRRFLWRAALRRRRSPALTEQRPPRDQPSHTGRAMRLQFPSLAWIGGTLAAACVALLVALHPRIGQTVRGDLWAAGAAKAEQRLGEDASPYPKQTQPVRGGGTPPTTSGAAGESAPSPVAGVADAGRPGATSPGTAEPSQPREFRFVANRDRAVAGLVVPLLDQVKNSSQWPVSSVQSRPMHFSGNAVVPLQHKPAFVAMQYVASPAARADSVVLSTGVLAVRAASVSRQNGTAIRGRHSYGSQASGERSTYYYPPDERFVVPVQPESGRPFSVPEAAASPPGKVWAIIRIPQPSFFGPGPMSFGYVDAVPRPFDYQLQGDWNSSFKTHPVLPHSPDAFAPRGPFDLFPRSRLDVRRFPRLRMQLQAGNTESYAYLHDNRFVTPADAPFSTFSVDVDTASYANVRRFIDTGRLPPPDAVRIEELVNYFPYHYAVPATEAHGAAPFAASLEVAAAPWAPGHRLVRIGLKARDVPAADRPRANLVFLLDVSGSMADANKLPLAKAAMRTLIRALRPDDRVAIVTCAGTSGLALPSTPVSESTDIINALDALTAGGSTNGGMGIQLAYDIAKANFVKGGINRVILCTDGDFNVGVTNEGGLTRLVQQKARSGVALTVLGFGMGNYKDSTLERLADQGNGNYGYVDSRAEATKLLRDQVDGTLQTVARDVKVQVDFNPARVARYRLIGYEDRALNAQDFNDDTVDAGEIGAGHAVTALYEIVPVGAAESNAPGVEPSRYGAGRAAATVAGPHANELLTVRIRYKQPNGDVSRKLEFPLVDTGEHFAAASADFKFAAAVAEFGMILRHSTYRGGATMGDVIASAAAGSAQPDDDPKGLRKQFIELALKAATLMHERQSR